MTIEGVQQASLYLAFAFVAMWLVVAYLGFLTLSSIHTLRLEVVFEHEEQEYLQQVISDYAGISALQVRHGFELVGAFEVKGTLGSPALVAWRQANRNTYLCAFLVPGLPIELNFISCFSEVSRLTTGNNRQGQMLPCSPHCWTQTFSVSDVSELWSHHEQATNYLLSTKSINPRDRDTTTKEDFERVMRQQAKFVSSLPLWPLRIPYWLLVRRYTWHNRSVENQN